MKTAARRELLDILDELSEIAPDFRLGQLVSLFTTETRHEGEPWAVYECEDEELLVEARFIRDSYRKLVENRIESSVATSPLSGSEAASRSAA